MGLWTKLLLLLIPVLSFDAQPPTYQIDLDQPPETRWNHAIQSHSQALKSVSESLLSSLSKEELRYFSSFLQTVFLDTELSAELKATSEIANVSMDVLAVLSFFYELNAYCTSIVVKESDGSLLHGRNLDYTVPAAMRDLVANVEFFRQGKLLYKATTFIGYFGVLTAVKPNSFAVSLDQRNSDDSLIWNIASAALGYQGNTLAIRKAFETLDTFEEVVKFLSETMLITDSYYIISGVAENEAAVITRNRRSAADVWRLDDSIWYLVETNYDHWEKDPIRDDRRTPATKMLEKFGEGKVTETQLMKVLSTRPVFNDRTIYTTLMRASTGLLDSTIRNLKPHEEIE